jgi:hypothetical protein
MKRGFKIGLMVAGALVLALLLYAGARITVWNPAWRIGRQFPAAEVRVRTVNSPDPRFWSALAGVFGIPMTDPDRSLTVTVDSHPEPLRLDDFAAADEAVLKNSRIADISAFLEPGTRLSGVIFTGCDFTRMPPEQRAMLARYSETVPDSFYLPYDLKRKR